MTNQYHNQILIGDTLTLLKKMPDELVDLGITSPPYNKQEKQKGWLVQNVKYDSMSDIQTESDYQQNQIDVLNELYRVSKAGGSFFYNHKTRMESRDDDSPDGMANKNQVVCQTRNHLG